MSRRGDWALLLVWLGLATAGLSWGSRATGGDRRARLPSQKALGRQLERATAQARPSVVVIRPAEDVTRRKARTGVVIAPGVVATSATHVETFGVEGLVVETASGAVHPAKLRGRDLRLRILLVQVPGLEAPPLAARQAPTPAGTLVLALGATFDPARGTATQGIVAASGRYGGRALQTDAELDMSNTGGPLIDLEGRLIAVTVHLADRLGPRSGVGFGMPHARIQAVLEPLLAGRELDSGRIGIHVDRVDDAEPGIRIRSPSLGGAAEAAGVQKDDRLLAIDGRTIERLADLQAVIADLYAGQEIELTIERAGEIRRIPLTVGSLRRR